MQPIIQENQINTQEQSSETRVEFIYNQFQTKPPTNPKKFKLVLKIVVIILALSGILQNTNIGQTQDKTRALPPTNNDKTGIRFDSISEIPQESSKENQTENRTNLTQSNKKLTNNYNQQNRCQAVTYYYIRQVDPEFGITKDQARALVNESVAAWENLINLNILEEKEFEGSIPIDFKINHQTNTVSQNIDYLDTQIQSLQRQLLNMQSEYSAKYSKSGAIATYNQALATYNTRNQQYAAKVNGYNEGQNNNNETAEWLENEQSYLENEFNRLVSEKLKLATTPESATTLNTQISNTESSLKKLYTQRNSYLKQIPDSGLVLGYYGSTPSASNPKIQLDEKIVLQVAQPRDGLKHTLTHELGHLMGLGHVNDPEANMNASEDKTILTPNQSDINEFKKHCLLLGT